VVDDVCVISCIAMSGGTPAGAGGFMRQRHSQGYAGSITTWKMMHAHSYRSFILHFANHHN
jgi:hypothetical protein